jgi:asparagine synthase (glutamine-hydrolysing)
MTIFGGALALHPDGKLPPSLREDLARALSRDPADCVHVHETDGCQLAFVDLELQPGTGEIVDADASVAMLSGDLLLSSRREATRDDDLRKLHERWRVGDDTLLRQADGSFAVAQWLPREGVLRLAVDSVGARTLYVAFAHGVVYFATALRVFESLGCLPKKLCREALLELAAFGFPLGTRTPYEDIEMLDGGEALEIRRGVGIRRYKYWDWQHVGPSGLSADDTRVQLYETFQRAVERRLDGSTTVLSFLSGGLDSRCVTASLRAAGVDVCSINIAPEGSADLELGRQAAEHLGTRHLEVPHGPMDGFDRIVAAHRTWLDGVPTSQRPTNPRVAWTGNGGSVGMGHVYLDDDMVSLMRQGRRRAAAEAYLKKNRIELSPRIFLGEYRKAIQDCCVNGVLDQLQLHGSYDEARRLFLFLMMNDQRRHLATLFENVDRYRLELVNPFFDRSLIRDVIAAPIELFIKHRFYNKWLEEFPYALASIPWQAYGDHEPCPLPIAERLTTQWAPGFYSQQLLRSARAELLKRAQDALANPRFPSQILRRPLVRTAWWLTRFGVRDYSYLLKTAANLTDYASMVAARA